MSSAPWRVASSILRQARSTLFSLSRYTGGVCTTATLTLLRPPRTLLDGFTLHLANGIQTLSRECGLFNTRIAIVSRGDEPPVRRGWKALFHRGHRQHPRK